MKFWPKRRNQAGDTIVEVLIAVAVVSSVLAGAYLVAQKSTLAVRDSQEHGEMLELLQGQVELVRSLALAQTDDTTGVFAATPKYFCINSSTDTKVDFSGGFSLPALDADSFTNYPAACSNIESRYNFAATYDSTTHVFQFYGRWNAIGGSKDEEQLSYRVYPNIPVAQEGGAAGDADLKDRPAENCFADYTAEGKNPYPDCWTITIQNSSINVVSTIDHCTLDWGDGSTLETYPGSDPHCATGYTFGPHVYPHIGSIDDQSNYTITLTNYFNNGFSPKTYSFSNIYIPY